MALHLNWFLREVGVCLGVGQWLIKCLPALWTEGQGQQSKKMIHRSRTWCKLDGEEEKSLMEITGKSHSTSTGLFPTYSAYSQLHNNNFLKSELGTLGTWNYSMFLVWFDINWGNKHLNLILKKNWVVIIVSYV